MMKQSPEHIRKRIDSRRRNGSYIFTDEQRKKSSESHKKNPNRYWLGKKRPDLHSEEVRKRMSEQRKGNKSHFWKGGIYPINKLLRRSVEYKLWRESVFKRDNWTCVWCGQIGGKLQADHIKPFSIFPELRFALDNGRTLCAQCHKKTDTWGAKIRNYDV